MNFSNKKQYRLYTLICRDIANHNHICNLNNLLTIIFANINEISKWLNKTRKLPLKIEVFRVVINLIMLQLIFLNEKQMHNMDSVW